MNLTIKSKLIILAVISLLNVTFSVGYAFIQQSQIRDAVDTERYFEEKSHILNSTVKSVYELMSSIDHALLEYFIYGNTNIKDSEITEQIYNVDENFQELSGYLSGNSEQEKLYNELIFMYNPLKKALEGTLPNVLETRNRADILELESSIHAAYQALSLKIASISEIAAIEEAEIKESLMQITDNTEFYQALIYILSLSIAIPMIYIVSRGIINPINNLSSAMNKIASNNDTNIAVPHCNDQDELGEMARNVKIFQKNIEQRFKLEQEQKELEQQSQIARQDALNNVSSQFENSIKGILVDLESTVNSLNLTSDRMVSEITNANGKSQSVGASSEQTSHNVQTVASAAEEMTSSIHEILQQISKSTSVVNETVSKVASADKTAQMLTNAASQIGNVVQLIRDIAEQINLLALNATIESARAGEAGKGFAVVASEVKNLASQTTKATEEIAKQIENVQTVSNEVAQVLDDIKGSIDNVNEYSGGIATAVEEQSAVISEIASSMQTAASSTSTIMSHINDVTGATSSADQAAGELVSEVKELSNNTNLLKTEVDRFLQNVKSA